MARFQQKIENALNEARILVLGGQVLIGSAYRSAFSPGFERLSQFVQNLRLISLVVMLFGLAILLLPVSYHRIAENGENTSNFHRVITRVLEMALLPFAIGLGVDVYTAIGVMRRGWIDVFVGLVTFLLAIGLWYIFAIFRRKTVLRKDGPEPTTLTDKIKEVLIEARMILPGAQALLGFQVATTLTDAFEELPAISKWMHLMSLLAIAVCTIFLIAPAAYHRIALNGEDNQEFYRMSGRFVILAMLWLALGVCADLFVIAQKTIGSFVASAVLAVAILVFFYVTWFGYSYYKKRAHSS